MTEQVIKTQLEEHKLILNTREKEIEELKLYRQSLLRDEERLLSLFTLSEERLIETEYVKVLQLSIDHYRDRCHHLEQKRIQIERDMDKITASRQQLIEQIKSEKMAQGITLDAEMRRLESDLNRIRGQRDSHLLHLEEQKAKELKEKEAQDKIISFASQGKLRIASLENRIQKLKADQEMAGPFAKEAITFKNIKDNIK
jgi:E3 ubiquitin-protein ligase BRE1